MARPAATDRRRGRGSSRGRLARAVLRGAGALAALLLLHGARAQDASDAPSTSSTIYVRTDSDQTTVVTPRIRVSAPVGQATRVDLVYLVDVWTSASIDIRTSASKAVTEQRDEIEAAVGHAFTDVAVSGSYRYSTEIDYESHGATLGAGYDFADNNASLALGARAYFDTVGRAGDPEFERSASMLSARASFTQVLDPSSYGQLVYELTRQQGYLASPYRYVRIADDLGIVPSTCAGVTQMCVQESNPGTRLRHAIAVSGRRALSSAVSLGASYRFYLDSWDMSSHTAGVDGAWIADEGWLLSLGYRLYHQGAASHYRPFYPAMPLPAHYTSDKELTALTSHRAELEVMRAFVLDDLGSELRAVLLGAPSFFIYHDHLLIDHIIALEVTFGLEVRL